MLSKTVSAVVVFALGLTGCTARSGPESLVAGLPSAEVTGSVSSRTAPVPQADVAAASAPARQAAPAPHELAWGGPVPETEAFDGIVRPEAAAVPSVRPVEVAMAGGAARAIAPQERTRIYGYNFSDAKPINFGKASPRKMPVHGVDVSRWQGDIDWQRLRTRGANFAFIKATDGGDHLDPMFRTNWRKSKEAGIRRGAYHFFYWCRPASHQADWFIRNVPNDPDALPPVIDVEYNGESKCRMRLSRAQVLEKMQVFMDRLERHYGKRPIIYTAPDFYKDHLSGELQDYPFWLRAVAQHPSKVYPDRKWLFWQYSGSGLSHGVEGKIDLNVFRGDEADWHRWVGKNSG